MSVSNTPRYYAPMAVQISVQAPKVQRVIEHYKHDKVANRFVYGIVIVIVTFGWFLSTTILTSQNAFWGFLRFLVAAGVMYVAVKAAGYYVHKIKPRMACRAMVSTLQAVIPEADQQNALASIIDKIVTGQGGADGWLAAARQQRSSGAISPLDFIAQCCLNEPASWNAAAREVYQLHSSQSAAAIADVTVAAGAPIETTPAS